MVSPLECYAKEKALWDTIQIPVLSKSSTGEFGITEENRPLAEAVIALIDASQIDPDEALSVTAEILEEKIETVRSFLPFPDPKTQSTGDLARDGYLEHLGNALNELRNESVLKNEKLRDPDTDLERNTWVNLLAVLNLGSRSFLQRQTGINCMEKDQKGRLKPIKII